MRKALWCSALATALLTTTYLTAQEPNQAEAQRQSPPAQQYQQPPAQTTAPMGTNPGTTNAQPQAPQADQAKPADVGPAQSNTASTGDTSGWPIGSTRQTAPSTVSAENAKLDKLPIISYSFWLDDEEKKTLLQGVENAPKAAGDQIKNAKVTELLPPGVESVDFPADVTQKLPEAGRYQFVKADNRVLVIDPNLKIIVAEIVI